MRFVSLEDLRRLRRKENGTSPLSTSLTFRWARHELDNNPARAVHNASFLVQILDDHNCDTHTNN